MNSSIYDKVKVNENFLSDQIYSEKDNSGNTNYKLNSELNESYLVIDSGKNLEELDKAEYNAINSQNNYHYYTNIKKYLSTISPFAGYLTAASSIIF